MNHIIAAGLALVVLAAPISAPAALAAGDFPTTIDNCGASITLDSPPKRIFMVNTDDVALLASLDAIDLVVARTSEPVEGIYDETVFSAIKTVPLIASSKTATGGSVISLETILAAQPDLVLAPENAVDRQLLAASGIPLYSPPAYCNHASQSPSGQASFERVYDQVTTFGKLLGRNELAAERVAALKQQVEELASASGDQGTGVALYVSAGGKTIYPYGGPSMVTPVFAAAGLTNIYADADQRVFEVSTEELLGKNPETIVLLYSEGTPDTVLAAFASVPGYESFDAVKTGRVVALPFSFTDPPTPNSIKGAGALAERLSDLQ